MTPAPRRLSATFKAGAIADERLKAAGRVAEMSSGLVRSTADRL